MRLVTAEEMRRFDARATDEFGIPSLLLMENAGIQVAREVSRQFPGGIRGKRVLLLCGKGNNGGDGFVSARHLVNSGAEVKLFLLASEREVRGDALTNLTIYQRMGGKVYALMDPKDLNALRMAILSTDLVVDAVYGTGFTGSTPELASRAFEIINEAGLPVVAVDLPSGLEADTGKIPSACLRATVTVTLGLPKFGLAVEPGASAAGEIVVADISLPREMIESTHIPRALLTEELCRSWLRRRPATAHKGDFGHLLIAGGQAGMAGAVVLAALGALRAGVGLLTVAVPQTILPLVAPQVPEAMTWSLPDQAGGLTGQSLQERDRSAFTATVVGPGLGRAAERADFLLACLEGAVGPVVIDADGLNALADNIDLLAAAKGPVILTPHPGEMARLAGCDTVAVQSDRAGVATRYAREWGCIIVLKGARTLVVTPDGQVYVNPTGNPGMAAGGSGDVLAGIIGALAAQGFAAERAAALGVYIHGLAGDCSARRLGQRAMSAGDIAGSLAEAWLQLELA
ncbi:yjef family protein [Heliomicrobium modesticaldum Ice1]|uniref:Bifunctional NAD(P)H-hydrate repair enzyme n=1 Tax=Heliobacterium modesticaldum (strain ATCC 51547 / Ice1) TaxID=498761 RepID=B0TE80_HELMI|nr:bifunctional ADP-dependent NAD(P)H-hydrate dehydratase/NAD(P)H-hydrate epimerase [Heliomicrobium modesticaldum]ABZ84275.1 yjef family protein [Heliomicrobium modesticaldum Ice1]